MTNKIRTGSLYVYHPNLLDRIDGRTNLKSGDIVRAIQPYGCPKNNTTGCAFVGEKISGKFIGLVHCNSLHTVQEYRAYLQAEIVQMQPVIEAKHSPIVWASKGGRA